MLTVASTFIEGCVKRLISYNAIPALTQTSPSESETQPAPPPSPQPSSQPVAAPPTSPRPEPEQPAPQPVMTRQRHAWGHAGSSRAVPRRLLPCKRTRCDDPDSNCLADRPNRTSAADTISATVSSFPANAASSVSIGGAPSSPAAPSIVPSCLEGPLPTTLSEALQMIAALQVQLREAMHVTARTQLSAVEAIEAQKKELQAAQERLASMERANREKKQQLLKAHKHVQEFQAKQWDWFAEKSNLQQAFQSAQWQLFQLNQQHERLRAELTHYREAMSKIDDPDVVSFASSSRPDLSTATSMAELRKFCRQAQVKPEDLERCCHSRELLLALAKKNIKRWELQRVLACIRIKDPVQRDLALLRIHRDELLRSSPEDMTKLVDEGFKLLLLRVHADKNREYPDLAHEACTFVNEARERLKVH